MPDEDRTLERERTILEEVIELAPGRLTLAELVLRLAQDPESAGEADEIRRGARELRRSGLIRYRNDDELLEATHAAIAAYRLLTA